MIVPPEMRFKRYLRIYHGIIFLLLIFAAINLFMSDSWAQDVHVIRPINVLIHKYAIETFIFRDKDKNPLSNKPITVKVDHGTTTAISIIRIEDIKVEDIKDSGKDKDSVFDATTDKDGQITFRITGLSEGTATTAFTQDKQVIGEPIAVNVIGVEARFEVVRKDSNNVSLDTEKLHQAPLTLVFSDISIVGGTFPGIVTARAWDFDDPDINKSVGDKIEDPTVTVVEFGSKSVYNVSLQITGSTTVGYVTDSTSTAIGVLPLPEEDGDGTVFGIVTDPDTGAPIAGASVTLIEGRTNRINFTDWAGSYFFNRVQSGTHNIFACAGANYNCLNTQVAVTKDKNLPTNFELTKVVKKK